MKVIGKHKIKMNLLPTYSYHQTLLSRGWTKAKKYEYTCYRTNKVSYYK